MARTKIQSSRRRAPVQRRNADDTRERILTTAIGEFAAKGYLVHAGNGPFIK